MHVVRWRGSCVVDMKEVGRIVSGSAKPREKERLREKEVINKKKEENKRSGGRGGRRRSKA